MFESNFCLNTCDVGRLVYHNALPLQSLAIHCSPGYWLALVFLRANCEYRWHACDLYSVPPPPLPPHTVVVASAPLATAHMHAVLKTHVSKGDFKRNAQTPAR